MDSGMDSLTAVSFRTRLEVDLGCQMFSPLQERLAATAGCEAALVFDVRLPHHEGEEGRSGRAGNLPHGACGLLSSSVMRGHS